MQDISAQWERTARLIGAEAVDRLRQSCVAVFGLGGVGGYTAEALARAGVGRLILVDGDVVSESNLNRQLLALHSTLGRPKTAVCAARIADINPHAVVEPYCLRYSEETRAAVPLDGCDYIADAIDDVRAKLLLIETAQAQSIPILCCMGTGNKLDPTAFRVADIRRTSMDPLCRVMRRALRERGVESVRVVYSDEPPRKPPDGERVPASVSFVPAAAGLLLAGAIIKDLIRPYSQD